MKRILEKGLNHNMAHWSELTLAIKWIHQAVTILDNEEDLPVLLVQQRFGAWMVFMSDHKAELGSLADSINHLLKITRSYWSGLFHCYRVANLPKTNNDLEQVFGSFRHHQRRTTGRKKAPASLLIRGSSRLISAVVTRIKTFTATDLATVSRSKSHEIMRFSADAIEFSNIRLRSLLLNSIALNADIKGFLLNKVIG